PQVVSRVRAQEFLPAAGERVAADSLHQVRPGERQAIQPLLLREPRGGAAVEGSEIAESVAHQPVPSLVRRNQYTIAAAAPLHRVDRRGARQDAGEESSASSEATIRSARRRRAGV